MENKLTEKKKKFELPHIFVILFLLIMIVTICTYFVPAGEYDRVFDEKSEREIIDPNSFHDVDANPTSLLDFITVIPRGLVEGAEIIFLIMVIGGTMEVITATGAMEAGINKLASVFKGKHELIVIPIFLAIFAVGGATLSLSDEVVAFVPIGIMLSRALGYDAIVGTAMVALGAASGVNAGIFSPFTTGVAQTISGLPLYSGAPFRTICLVVFVVLALIHISKYAKKIKQDPSKSLVYDIEQKLNAENIQYKGNALEFTTQRKLVILVFVAGIAIAVAGLITQGWYITELAGVYLFIGIIGGLIGGLNTSELADSFGTGASNMVFGGIVVGMAKAISIIISDASILDTIVYSLASIINYLPRPLMSLGIYFIQIILNFFITSGSGLATVSTPIMAPLAEILGITKQTAVLAFNFGDGFTNSIIPTSAELMAYLAVAKIPYPKWFKFIWKLMLMWAISGAVLLIIADAIKLGPF